MGKQMVRFYFFFKSSKKLIFIRILFEKEEQGIKS